MWQRPKTLQHQKPEGSTATHHAQEHGRESFDEEVTVSPDFSPVFSPNDLGPGLEDQEFADPLQTVQSSERQQGHPYLEDCRYDSFIVVGDQLLDFLPRSANIRWPRDELMEALSRLQLLGTDQLLMQLPGGGDCK